MWFNRLQVTTGQPLGDTCPAPHCRFLLANNVEEEVQMNPGASGGHVYLTPWPVNQSAVRPLLTVDRGMICRVTGASVWQAAHLYTTETLPRWETISLLVTVNSYRVQLERLYSALIYGKFKLKVTINIFILVFVLDPECGLLKAYTGLSFPILSWRHSPCLHTFKNRWLTCFGNSSK